MRSWESTFERRALEAPCYRGFLKLFFQEPIDWKKPKPLSFGQFAERSGFSSKSFMNDVIAGRKRITPKSFERVVLGLGLSTTWQQYFKFLVAIDEEAFRSPRESREELLAKLKELRQKLKRRSVKQIHREHSSSIVDVFVEEDFPEVYASLGALESGADLPTIRNRSRLPEGRIKIVLSKMISAGLVSYDETAGRYLPKADALNADDLRNSETFMRDFLRSQQKARVRLVSQVATGESLFMSQTFSVDSKRLSALKVELGKLIESFVAEAEEAEGDCVSEICISFTNNGV